MFFGHFSVFFAIFWSFLPGFPPFCSFFSVFYHVLVTFWCFDDLLVTFIVFLTIFIVFLTISGHFSAISSILGVRPVSPCACHSRYSRFHRYLGLAPTHGLHKRVHRVHLALPLRVIASAAHKLRYHASQVLPIVNLTSCFNFKMAPTGLSESLIWAQSRGNRYNHMASASEASQCANRLTACQC